MRHIIPSRGKLTVLISGHHKKIEEWRKARQEERTKEKRPDIWKHYLKLNKSENNDE